MAGFYAAVVLVVASSQACYGIRCITCTVDFRLQPFDMNHPCLFPQNNDDLVHCSSASKFCKATITRVGGIFNMLARTCTAKCTPSCTEKGFGIRFKECTSCCTKDERCGSSELMKTGKVQDQKSPTSVRPRNEKKNSGDVHTSTGDKLLSLALVVVVISLWE